MTDTSTSAPARRLRAPALGTVALALVAYVPLLLTRPGQVGADTKTYLYLDPARLLSRAAWMWDTSIGLGTVTHQNIGYLWPMGPWYWTFAQLGVPDWVAQRIWLGTIIFAAGTGVRFLLKELRWVGPGATVAAFAYALSPYLLHYGARISVILLPFAGLPWLIALVARSVRRGGWRWPAVFALVTLTVGGVNATSLLLVMAGPLLWMLHTVFITREATFRATFAAGLRIAALTVATSLWWIIGLVLQGSYGIPILRYTETYNTVANAALSTELVRGLGYWFFYGRDSLGAWISPAARLAQSPGAMTVSFLIPGLAIVSGFLTRFRNRGYFALLVLVGVVVGVGAHPWDGSSPLGAAFRAWTGTDAGLAFRSTPRAVPLIALGLAVMLGAGVAAVCRVRPAWHPVVAGTLLVLICLNQWPLFGGEMVDRNLRRPEQIPSYWDEAAAAMDAGDPATRVLEVPGTDFASYRWGETVDPITPGLIDRPFVARELIPYGTPAAANLVNALDVPLQQGTFDPRSLVPVAQLMGVGTVAHRGDLQYERFRTPRPDQTFRVLQETPGLDPPQRFGTDVRNDANPLLPLDDEVELGTPPSVPRAPAVSLFDLADTRPIARTVSAASPTVIAGDGSGIVNWAASGALDPDRPILSSASFAQDPARLDSLVSTPGAQLVVTDTNRRAARRWGSVRENDGYTEVAGETPVERDPTDNRLDVFPGAGDDTQTVAEQIGGATVQASAYGNPVSYTPADRAVRAMDGDPSTAWRVAAFGEPRGEYLQIRANEPVTTDHLQLLQSLRAGNRWITAVELGFDGGEPVPVALDDSSRSVPGQRIDFPQRTFRELRITITEANLGELDRYVGVSDVGIAEVTIPDVDPVTEVIRPPTDLLAAAGPASIDQPLTYVYQRRSGNPAEVVVDDEEQLMQRWVEGPADRSFTTFGSIRLDPRRTSAQIDTLLGMPDAAAGGLTASASGTLAGDLRSRATSAVDGDPDTAWQTPVNDVRGQSIRVESAAPFATDGLELRVRRDGLHSIPSRVTVQFDDAAPLTVDVAAPDPGPVAPGATATLTVPVPATTAQRVTLTVDEIVEANSKDWFTGNPTVLPVGIVDLGLPVRATVPADDSAFTTGCRDDLVAMNGTPVPVVAAGTVGAALDRAPLDLAACGPELRLAAGRQLLSTTPASATGIAVNSVVLASAAGGTAGADTLVDGPAPAPAGPTSTSEQPSRLTWTTAVTAASQPYWVVLGQSLSPGFRATTASGVDLGPPTLINGYANGWLIDPATVGADQTITITWAPQRLVWFGLAASALGVLVCIALLCWPRRQRSRVDPVPTDPVGIAPLGVDGPVPTTAVGAVLVLGTAAVSWLIAGPFVAVGMAAVAALAAFVPRGQVVVRIVGIGMWAAAAGFVILKELRNQYVIDFNWMNQFEITHAWTLAAVICLALDPIVSALRKPPGETEPASDPTD